MAKQMTLSKRWFTREDADGYGDVEDDNPDLPYWIVIFPDDPFDQGEGGGTGPLT